MHVTHGNARQRLLALLAGATAQFDELYLIQSEPWTQRLLSSLKAIRRVAGEPLGRGIDDFAAQVLGVRSLYRRIDGRKVPPSFSEVELDRARDLLPAEDQETLARHWVEITSLLFDETCRPHRSLLRGLYGAGIARPGGVATEGAGSIGAETAEIEAVRARLREHPEREELTAVDTRVEAVGDELRAVKYHDIPEYGTAAVKAARLLLDAATVSAGVPGVDASTAEYFRLVARSLTKGIPAASPGRPRDWNPADELVVKLDHGRNGFCFIASPVMETYIDQLLGRKGEARAFLVVDNPLWSSRGRRFAALFPRIETMLNVPDDFKRAANDVLVPTIVSGDVLRRCGGAWNLVAFTLPNVLPPDLIGRQVIGHFVNAAQAEASAMLPYAETVLSSEASELCAEAFASGLQWKYIAHEASHNTTIFSAQSSRTAALREVLGEHYLPLEELRGECMLVETLARARTAMPDLLAVEELAAAMVHTALLSPILSNRFGVLGVYALAKNVLLNYLRSEGVIEIRGRRAGVSNTDRLQQVFVTLSNTVLDLYLRACEASSRDAKRDARSRAGEFLARWTFVDPELQGVLDCFADYRVPSLADESGLRLWKEQINAG